MIRFLSTVLLAMFAASFATWPSMAVGPLVSGPSSPKTAYDVKITFVIGDTADSRAIPVSGFCSVRYEQASGDDASLYAVTTASTAATSGTLIAAFTSSTTTATTFTAGTRWVKAVATDATAGGSVMQIDCAPLTGSGGSGSASFSAERYAAGSTTGGIVEAITACHAAGGGVVIVPPGQTDIDADVIGETATIFNLTENADDYEADCDIIGYGRSKPTEGGVDADFGSFIKITNADGNTGFRVNGNGQTLSDFTIQMTGTSASTVAIDIASDTIDGQTCDGTCAKGEAGLNEFLLKSVNVLGPSPASHGGPSDGGPGVGINLTYLLKSRFEDSEIHFWDYGIQYTASSDATPATPSNANLFQGMTLRKNDVGFRLADAYLCTDVKFQGSTFEGNTYGFHATSAVTGGNSACLFFDNGNYWENDQHNVFIQGNQLQLTSIGSVFSTTNTGDDVARDVADAKGIPDIIIGARGTYGLAYTNGAEAKVIGGMWNGVDSIVAATIVGDIGVHATDCPGAYGTSTTYAVKNSRGDACYEVDSRTLWVCKPAGATDGQCDASGDWVNVESTGSTVYGPSLWAISNAGTFDTGTEVCAGKLLSCQDVLEFSTPATPTDSACATTHSNGVKILAFCY